MLSAIEELPLQQLDLSKLGDSPDTLTSLVNIITKNSKAQLIKFDYHHFLQSSFQENIKNANKNSFQFKIELVGDDEKTLVNAEDLRALMEAMQALSNHLDNVQVVIDLSMLEQDLREHLVYKQLIYLHKCLLEIDKKEKFILSPCHDTHKEIMAAIHSYLIEPSSQQSKIVEQLKSNNSGFTEMNICSDPHEQVQAKKVDNPNSTPIHEPKKRENFFTDNELELTVDAGGSFNIDDLDEELRKDICALIIKAADNYHSTNTVYAPPYKIVNKDKIDKIEKNAEWYLYIDTISKDEINSSEKAINANRKISQEVKTKLIEKIGRRNVIKGFIEFHVPSIKVSKINDTSSHSEMFPIEDARTFIKLPRVIFLIHSENIDNFLGLAEKLRKQAEVVKAMPNDKTSPSTRENVIKPNVRLDAYAQTAEKEEKTKNLSDIKPESPKSDNFSQKKLYVEELLPDEITSNKPTSVTKERKRSAVTLEQLISENNLLALQAFLPFFSKEQAKEGRDNHFIILEEKPDAQELTIQAGDIKQLPWLQPVIDMLMVLDSYIAVFNHAKLGINSHGFQSSICPILICLNAILERLNTLKSDSAKVLEIPNLFAELNKLISHAEDAMSTSFISTIEERESKKKLLIEVSNLPSQKAKHEAYEKTDTVRLSGLYKLKAAQYGLYAVAMLALITSIVVGLLVTLPYVAIPVAITLLALVIAEAARRQKHDFVEKINTNRAAHRSMPKIFSDYPNTYFKPVIWQPVNDALTFFKKEGSNTTDTSVIQSVESFLEPVQNLARL